MLFKTFQLDDFENHVEDDEERGPNKVGEAGDCGSELTLLEHTRNSLVDLSLNLGSVNFL